MGFWGGFFAKGIAVNQYFADFFKSGVIQPARSAVATTSVYSGSATVSAYSATATVSVP